MTLKANGRIAASGQSAAARALGRDATIAAEAILSDTDLLDSSIAIDAAALRFRAKGAFRQRRLDYRATLELLDLARLVRTLEGSASLSGTIAGPLESAVTRLTGRASIASKGFKRRSIDLSASATGFPTPRQAQLRMFGSLNDAPLSARADLTAKAGRSALTAAIAWKSLRASMDLSFPRAVAGDARLDIGALADLAPFLSTKLGGALAARVDLKSEGARQMASFKAQASNLAIEGAKAGALTASGQIAEPFAAPALSLGLKAQNVSAMGMTGEGAAALRGPLKALAISLDASLKDRNGAPVAIDGAGTLDANARRFALSRLALSWRGQKASLAGTATLDFARGLSVDRLTIAAGGGTARLSGRFSPDLSAQLSARSISAGLLSPFVSQPLQGTISTDAQLAGTIEAPKGSYAIAVHGLSARSYSARTSLDIDAKGALDGRKATVEATASAGATAHLVVNGALPLSSAGSMTMRASGTVDLTLFNPLIAAEGRRVRGTATVDLRAEGPFAAPRVDGGASVKSGEFQDYARGARLRAITADIRADGAQLRIADLSASAGPGTIKGSGSIVLSAPGTPLDVSLRLDNAQPIASDLLTARATGVLRVSGALRGSVAVSGKLDVGRATINIPERFPPQIAVLDVRRKGQKPPPEAEGGDVALDIALSTSGPIFVRGRGLDADMSGDIRLGGTIAAPIATGKFEMNRGTVTLAGQTLTFTTGKLGFDGAGIRNRLDPSLDFVAQSASGGVTATLTVGGHASAPKITLSSAPELPQDEILARLLFQQSAKQLTPIQLAQIAQAIAALGGVGTGFDPLGALRKNLGLDRLSIGSASGGASGSETQTTVEGGKYVSRNVYVGAKQTLSGSSLVQVQVDLTKQLKAQATLSTGTNATATKGSAAIDNGSSVGLTYEFEY
jgi:translocation and assembly module TamB